MTVARLTKRRNKLERHALEIIHAISDGASQRDIAKRFNVSEAAVSQFMTRHSAELQELDAAVIKGVEDYIIAHKVNRTAVRDMLHSGLLEVKQARSKGLTGEDTGLVVREYKVIGSGDSAIMVEEWKVDKSLIELIDRLERSTAEELGQLPKAGDLNIQVNTGPIIRLAEGFDPDLLT